MKSHDANDHGASGHNGKHAKKPWVTPSLQVITLQSAENGQKKSTYDGVSGGNSLRPYS